MKRPYQIDEQETTINVFPATISGDAEVYSCIPQMIKRLRQLHTRYPDDVSILEKQGAVTATVPRGWIKIQPKRKCTLSEEQKRANAERLRAVRESKQGVNKQT